MTFSVTILGSSSALPTLRRNPSAHALNVHEQIFLIDCGEGTQLQLQRYGINMLKVNAVFITHLHGDHIYGIFGLLSSMNLLGRKRPLEIFAPRPFDEVLANHLKYFDQHLGYEVIWREVRTRSHEMIFENKVMEVWTVPLRHTIPSAGFLFREKTPPLNIFKEQIKRYSLGIAAINAAKRGENITLDDGTVIPNGELTYTPYVPRSYAYCSDTQPSGKVAEIVKGADLLYHEATFMQADKALAKGTGHSTTVQAAETARKAGTGKLLIGHFSSRYKDDQALLDEARAVFPDTVMAREGERIDIPAARYERR